MPVRRPSAELSPAAKQWVDEHRQAFEAFNKWYLENGSPLDKYRMF